jgi:hypothetical protein
VHRSTARWIRLPRIFGGKRLAHRSGWRRLSLEKEETGLLPGFLHFVKPGRPPLPRLFGYVFQDETVFQDLPEGDAGARQQVSDADDFQLAGKSADDGAAIDGSETENLDMRETFVSGPPEKEQGQKDSGMHAPPLTKT